MRRPGPLQELPPEDFASNIRESDFFKSRPNKRRLSPARSSKPSSRSLASARFSEVLRGPESPAKKLAFGSPYSTAEHSAPIPQSTTSSFPRGVTPSKSRSSSSSTKLAPSPEFQSRPSKLLFPPGGAGYCIPPEFHTNPITTTIPRETLPTPDPQSIHYPGFRVHLDSHVILPTAQSDQDQASGSDQEKDDEKENIAPRKKARKSMGTLSSSDLKSITSPPESKRGVDRSGKVKPTMPTPGKNLMICGTRRGNMAMLTPRKVDTDVIMSATPVINEKERKERRRILEDETDGAECADEDLI